jgi:hypothetical protein
MLRLGLAARIRCNEWRIHAEAPNTLGSAGGMQRRRLSRECLREEVFVIFEVLMEQLRKICLVVDCFLRTSRHTGAAVDTLVRLNVECSCAFVNAIHRALLDT